MYTDAEIEHLISCKKRIVQPPKKKMRVENGHERNDMKLVSDEGRNFTVFMRASNYFPENFTIGLKINEPDGTSTILMRCNGDHGEHANHVKDMRKFSGYHIHLATQEALANGKCAENFAVPTDSYASYTEAFAYFIKAVNIVEPENCPTLSSARQLRLV